MRSMDDKTEDDVTRTLIESVQANTQEVRALRESRGELLGGVFVKASVGLAVTALIAIAGFLFSLRDDVRASTAWIASTEDWGFRKSDGVIMEVRIMDDVRSEIREQFREHMSAYHGGDR